jgi:predicted DNA-binding transcriptional regulator AlpA
MEKLLLSIPDAMKLAALSRSALYERLSDGSIQAVKNGRKTLVVVSSLQAWAASLPVATFKPSTKEPTCR